MVETRLTLATLERTLNPRVLRALRDYVDRAVSCLLEGESFPSKLAAENRVYAHLLWRVGHALQVDPQGNMTYYVLGHGIPEKEYDNEQLSLLDILVWTYISWEEGWNSFEATLCELDYQPPVKLFGLFMFSNVSLPYPPSETSFREKEIIPTIKKILGLDDETELAFDYAPAQKKSENILSITLFVRNLTGIRDDRGRLRPPEKILSVGFQDQGDYSTAGGAYVVGNPTVDENLVQEIMEVIAKSMGDGATATKFYHERIDPTRNRYPVEKSLRSGHFNLRPLMLDNLEVSLDESATLTGWCRELDVAIDGHPGELLRFTTNNPGGIPEQLKRYSTTGRFDMMSFIPKRAVLELSSSNDGPDAAQRLILTKSRIDLSEIPSKWKNALLESMKKSNVSESESMTPRRFASMMSAPGSTPVLPMSAFKSLDEPVFAQGIFSRDPEHRARSVECPCGCGLDAFVERNKAVCPRTGLSYFVSVSSLDTCRYNQENLMRHLSGVLRLESSPERKTDRCWFLGHYKRRCWVYYTDKPDETFYAELGKETAAKHRKNVCVVSGCLWPEKNLDFTTVSLPDILGDDWSPREDRSVSAAVLNLRNADPLFGATRTQRERMERERCFFLAYLKFLKDCRAKGVLKAPLFARDIFPYTLAAMKTMWGSSERNKLLYGIFFTPSGNKKTMARSGGGKKSKSKNKRDGMLAAFNRLKRLDNPDKWQSDFVRSWCFAREKNMRAYEILDLYPEDVQESEYRFSRISVRQELFLVRQLDRKNKPLNKRERSPVFKNEIGPNDNAVRQHIDHDAYKELFREFAEAASSADVNTKEDGRRFLRQYAHLFLDDAGTEQIESNESGADTDQTDSDDDEENSPEYM